MVHDKTGCILADHGCLFQLSCEMPPFGLQADPKYILFCIISTSFIRFAGLKKCKPIILSGKEVCSAIAVTEREEVLVAKMVSSVLMPAVARNRADLDSGLFYNRFYNQRRTDNPVRDVVN